MPNARRELVIAVDLDNYSTLFSKPANGQGRNPRECEAMVAVNPQLEDLVDKPIVGEGFMSRKFTSRRVMGGNLTLDRLQAVIVQSRGQMADDKYGLCQDGKHRIFEDCVFLTEC